MFRALYLQCIAAVIVALGAGMLVGARGALSAGLGAMACILPNLLFALRLKSVSSRPGASYPVNFFIGEIVKIAATIVLLAVAIRGYPEMHWPSLLIGFAIVLQSGFIAFWKKS